MSKTSISIEIDTTGPFPAYISASITAQATLDDGRVGTSKVTPQHRSQQEPYTGGDILTAVEQALQNAQGGALPASVDSFTRYAPDSIDFGQGAQAALAAMDKNWERLREIDEEQKAKGELVGRYVAHPIADGQAVYQITNIQGGQATIEVCRGLGDDWTIPAWGTKTNINLGTAENLVKQRDGMKAIFGKA